MADQQLQRTYDAYLHCPAKQIKLLSCNIFTRCCVPSLCCPCLACLLHPERITPVGCSVHGSHGPASLWVQVESDSGR